MKKMSKRLVCLLLIATMILFAVGCKKAEPGTTPTTAPAATQAPGAATAAAPEVKSSKDTLIVANTTGEPGNLHPYNTISIGLGLINRTMIEYLITTDDEGNFVPNLAESWEAVDTGITFHLRKGVKFHNGEELKASDVVFCLNELITKSTAGYAPLFSSVDIANVKAVDDYTVQVPTTQPDTTLLTQFADTLGIVSEKAYTELGEKFQYQPVGTGPFKFKSWQVGDNVTVERFDDYWGGAALLKEITFRTIAETSQAMIELETGGVDIVVNPLGSDIQRVSKGEVKDVKAVTNPTSVLRNNNLNFNFQSETMKNHKVREAIAYTIDREAWTNVISPGNGVPAYSCVAGGVWGYDPSIKDSYPYKTDIAKAKALMAEAGYANGFNAILLTDQRPYHQAACELIQAALSQIGITVEVQTMELAQQKEVMSTGKGYDLYMLDNVGNASNFLQPLWRDAHPKTALYRYYTVNTEQGQKFADLLDQIQITVDNDARAKLAKELQKVFTEDIIWLPLNSIQSYFLCSAKLEGAVLKGDTVFISNKAYFK